jgi:hypothetical protein
VVQRAHGRLEPADDPGFSLGTPERKLGIHGSPTIRSAGIQQSSKKISRVGEPWIPSLRSGVPSEKPGSSAWTTKAEIPRGPTPCSVTAITV